MRVARRFLDFPGGCPPALDLSHPAARRTPNCVGQLRLATVSTTGGAQLDLVSNVARTWATPGNAAGGADNWGPWAAPAGGTSGGISWPYVPESKDGMTMAVIYQPRGGSSGAGQGVVGDNIGGPTFKIAAGLSGSTYTLDTLISGSGYAGLTIYPGQAYFYAFTMASYQSGASKHLYAVCTNLLTGELLSFQTTSPEGVTTQGTNYNTITYTGGTTMPGRVYAASLGTNFLTFDELLEWAADPWGLWYNRNVPDTIFNGIMSYYTPPVGGPLNQQQFYVGGTPGPMGANG